MPRIGHQPAAVQHFGEQVLAEIDGTLLVERAETVRQLELLPLLARSQGQPIVAAADAALVAEGLAFPDGWRATALDPLRIAANGICQPGRVRVEGGGTAEEWTLAAPDCRVDPAP